MLAMTVGSGFWSGVTIGSVQAANRQREATLAVQNLLFQVQSEKTAAERQARGLMAALRLFQE